MRILAVLSLFLTMTLPTHAAVYKWVDSQGNVHYTDQPPPEAKSKRLDIRSQPAAPKPATETPPPAGTEAKPATRTPATPADKEMEFRKRRVEAEEARKKQEAQEAEAKQKRENCTRARGRLRTLQEGPPVYEVTEQGERRYLEDKARQEAMERARQEVDYWCKEM